MKRICTLLLLIPFFGVFPSFAQINISTTGSFSNNNGSGLTTFNFENTTSSSVIITDVSTVLRSSGASNFYIWYSTSPVNGSPGVISSSASWTLAATNSINSTLGSGTNQTEEPVFSGISLIIPANTTYGIAIGGFTAAGTGTMGYYSIPSSPSTVTFSGGGCNIITGANISYGATTYTGGATFSPRGFVGTITFIPGVSCSGQPDAGVLPDTLHVCPDDPFMLTAVGATMASGIDGQWQSSPAGANTWTDISGATAANYTIGAGITVATDYRYLITCTISSMTDTSNVMSVLLNAPSECYCTPSNSYSTNYYINDFSTTGGLQNITNNGSGFSPGGYGDFTATDTVSAQPGMTISISAAQPSSTYEYGVWVDWNHDGDFDDVGEKVLSSGGYVSAPFTGSFTVPISALTGTTRLRIRNAYLSQPAPVCGSFNYGEAEDYILNVIPKPLCDTAVLPTSVVAAANLDTLCVSGDINLDLDTVLMFTGITYQWESAPAASGPWTNLDAAQTDPAKAVLNVDSTTWYRCNVLCSGTAAITSSPISVYVNNPQVLSIPDSVTHCGPGSVSITGIPSGGNELKWYENETGGSSVATGNTFTTPFLTDTDTFYVSASDPSGGGGSVVKITEMDIGSTDGLEIQNVGTATIDVTGWKVAISNSYSNIQTVNSIVQTLSGTLAPGAILSWTDNSSNNYWGNNILWDPSGKGWVLLLDANDNIIDFVSQDWPESTVNTTTLTIGAATVSLNGEWIGSGLNGSAAGTNSFQRTGSADNNNASDFVLSSSNIGTANGGSLILPFAGGGCESPRQPVIVVILPSPQKSLGNDTALCDGATGILLDAGNPGSTYLWNTGGTAQTITAGAAGLYTVTVTNPDGCTTVDSIEVTVGVMPMSNMPDSLSICEGATAQLDAGNSGSNFVWSTGATSQTINVQNGGNYHVAITSSTGCILHDTTVVTQLLIPVVDLGVDTLVCPGDTVTLDAGNAGSDFIWNTGAIVQSLPVMNSGTYSVLVTGNNGCSQSDTIVIASGVLPQDNLVPIIDLCSGDTAFLDAGNAGSSYLWSTGATSQVIGVATGAVYSVVVTNSMGCRIETGTEVVLRPLPVVSLGADTSICENSAITLDAGNPGYSYYWNTGDTIQEISVVDSGLYSVAVTSPFQCISSDDIHVALIPGARVSGFDFIPLFNEDLGKVQFYPINPLDVDSFKWDFGDGSHGTGSNPIHVYEHSGNYLVSLKVTNNCGSFSVSLPIHVNLTTGIVSLTNNSSPGIILYPNPANDQITIKSERPEVKMKHLYIYNVLGQKVYDKNISGKAQQQISVTHLVSGLYSARITTESHGVIVRKFEVVR